MDIYINSSSCISAQDSFNSNLDKTVEYTGSEIRCLEPNYNTLLDPKTTRRMSRIIKMGMATAVDALKKVNSPNIDAIITGTGLGCLDDTGHFLSALADTNNRMMSPTSFIQSTHNTVGSQVALHLGNKGYNCTYSHQDISFENALQDASLLLKSNETKNILLGGFDELTPHLVTLLKRLDFTRKEPITNTQLYNTTAKGTIAGEGSAFFVLSNKKSEINQSRITDLQIIYKPKAGQLEQIFKLMNNNHQNTIIITGKNGDQKHDEKYMEFDRCIKATSFNYKHLCGSYPTSTSFALWLATQIIVGKNTPLLMDANTQIEHIYIYHCNSNYHTIIRIDK